MLYDLRVTPAALKKVAEWIDDAPDSADVELCADDRMLLAEQGDDRAAFDTDGSPGSDEYLSLAPLDPRAPAIPVSELAAAIGLPDADENGLLPGSAADQCAAVYALLGHYGIEVA